MSDMETRFNEAKALYNSKQYDKAAPLLQALADEGHAKAQYLLAECYADRNRGVERSPSTAEKLRTTAVKGLKEAANQGDAEAQFYLGNCSNTSDAIWWWTKAAEQGYAEAQYKLGWKFSYEKDKTKASFEWYQKAAEQGYVDAYYKLAQCFDYSLGVEEDKAKALEWYQKAAEGGNVAAQKALGESYRLGTRGLAKDYAKAREWLGKAAEQGDHVAEGQLELTNTEWRLHDGFNEARDLYNKEQYDKAVPLLQALAEEGHAESQFYLGACFSDGQGGLAKDDAKAAEWWQKAAEKGDANAQYSFGYSLKTGRGIKQDEAKAKEWFYKAADQGNPYAKEQLGISSPRPYWD